MTQTIGLPPFDWGAPNCRTASITCSVPVLRVVFLVGMDMDHFTLFMDQLEDPALVFNETDVVGVIDDIICFCQRFKKVALSNEGFALLRDGREGQSSCESGVHDQ